MFGDRLKELREEKAISQREVARLLQLSPSTIAMYELNQRSPDKDTIVKIANLLGCTTDYLLGTSEIKNFWTPAETKETPLQKLPVLGNICKDLPLLSEENIEGYFEVPASIDGDFVVRVEFDTMIGAGILNGDYAVCKQADKATSGQIVLILTFPENGCSEKSLWFFFEEGGQQVYKPANPQIPEITAGIDGRIAGIMVASIRIGTPSYQLYEDYLRKFEMNRRWERVGEKRPGLMAIIKSYLDRT